MDLSFLENALALASTAVGVTGKAASTAETIKKLFAGDKAPDAGEATKLVNALAVELTAANVMNVDLSNALKSLSQQIKAEDQFEKEKSRYQLVATAKGDMVYQLREDMADGQPAHYVCPVCLNGEKQFMFIRGSGDVRHCQGNKAHWFRFDHTPRPPVVTSRRRGSWMAD